MPAHKKDPSTRARRNKTATRATLTRNTGVPTAHLAAMTVAQLRDEIRGINASRPHDAAISARGPKAQLLERLAAALSPVPPLPPHPPCYNEVTEEVEPAAWHPQTVAWWNDVWTSPMATEWDDSDIHNVGALALLYDDIWTSSTPSGRKNALAEYRLQRADLGLSPYSRRRLEWTIATADEAKTRGKRRNSETQAPTPPPDPASDPRLTLVG